MKKNKLSREFKVGAFGLAMIALLYFSINFIKSSRIFSNDQTFYAVFESADGLEVSAPVIARGFRIGTVEKVKFDLDRQDIIVTFSIQKEYPVGVGSKVKITSDGLMGGQVMELTFLTNPQKYKDKDTIPSVFEPSLMQMVGSEYSSIKDKLKIYAAKIELAIDGLNGVLSPENVANLNASMSNLNTITGDISSLVANKKQNIENIITNLDQLSKSLASVMPKVDSTVNNFAKASQELPLMLINANSALANLNEMLAKVKNGEGSLGKVVSDEELYANLAKATESLNLLLADVKENPKRYVNVTVFGKKTYEEKQADKAAKKADKEKAKANKKN